MTVETVHSNQMQQFEMLRAYDNTVLARNQESTVIIKAESIETDNASVFEVIFVAFGSIIEGLFNGCRKI